MSFRRSGESLDGLVTQELEARRKAQQQIAILARDQETLRSDTAADIAMAVAEATDLGMGYVYRNTNAAALADATSTLLT